MDKRSRLFENVFSLVTLRGMEYVLAFLLIPYLLRVLGPAKYGSIAFMQGIIAYFTLVINYGFNLTAPRDIALAEESQLPHTFSRYFWGTLFLWLACSGIFGFGYLILSAFFQLAIDLPLFFATYMTTVGLVIFPVWFFQGIQQMRYITILNVSGRLLAMVFLFYFIQSPEDYVLAAFLHACPTVFAGLISWKIIMKEWPEILCKPAIKDIWVGYKEGWLIFLSNLAVNLYTTSDVVILGVLTNATIVGYYSGAEKLISCVRRGVGAVSDAIYPHISLKFKENQTETFLFLRKQLKIYVIGGFLGGLLIFSLSPIIVPMLLGSQYIPSIEVLQVMAFVPLAVGISTIFGYETMLPLGMQQLYSRILIAASALNLVMIVPFIMWKGAFGVAFCVAITETFIMLTMGWVLWKQRVLLR